MSSLNFMPLTPAFGAEVKDLDITRMDDTAAAALRQAWARHKVLVLRGQQAASEDDHVRYAQVFGPAEASRFVSPLANRPEIMIISNVRDTQGKALGALPDGEMTWHFDRIHQKVPNKGSVLHAREVPSRGGHTRFLDMVSAFAALPEALKARIRCLQAESAYDYGATQPDQSDRDIPLGTDQVRPEYRSELPPSAVHPVVRTLPETGEAALYVCRLMTRRILGIPETESATLLEELFSHCEQERFVYEHHWRVGDMVLWDNRCTMHARTDFPGEQRRVMARVTVADTVPPC